MKIEILWWNWNALESWTLKYVKNVVREGKSVRYKKKKKIGNK